MIPLVSSTSPTSGCVVQCRSHRWLVEEVEPAEHPEGDTVVQMACRGVAVRKQDLEDGMVRKVMASQVFMRACGRKLRDQERRDDL